MLWLPNKKSLKAMTRARQLRRRRRIARLLLLWFLCFGLGAASAPPQHALLVEVNTITAAHQFDFVDWEFGAIASEIQRRWDPPPLPDSESEQQALVLTFLQQEEYIAELKHKIDDIFTAASGSIQQTSPLVQELTEVRATQTAIKPQIEMILSRQVETVLRDEGFTTAELVFPPVAFRFVDPPTGLVLSPRDKIQNEHFVGLQPGLKNNHRAEIEAVLDQRGDVSSYITDIGGLGSYPTMVIGHAFLPYLINTIAHEWTHNYLYTFPTNIAWGYQTYPQLMTINETTATLVGEEISRKVITRFYPDWVKQLPPVDHTGQALPAEPSEFSVTMRYIRQEVDRLLAESKIEAAETFMETERLKLVEKGHNLRKLNQAYFAFHGSYALSPGSIDPAGPQIRQLRAASPSLKAFLNRMGWLNSYDEYLEWLTEVSRDPQSS
jgi:hypothetical protein